MLETSGIGKEEVTAGWSEAAKARSCRSKECGLNSESEEKSPGSVRV